MFAESSEFVGMTMISKFFFICLILVILFSGFKLDGSRKCVPICKLYTLFTRKGLRFNSLGGCTCDVTF